MTDHSDRPLATAVLSEPPQSPVLRVEEVAAWLRVSKDLIYKAAADGTLPALRLGRALRFSRAAVARWIDGEAAS